MRTGSIIVGIVLWVVLVSVARAAEPNKLPPREKVAEYLQEVSVTIKASSSEGSGVVKTREIGGKSINFVWTAAHVVDDLRSVKEVIDPKTGTKRQHVTFRDCAIVKELVEGGRRVGELKMEAEIIRYSEEEDLSLLRIRKTDFVDASVVFYLKDDIPAIGTHLLHVGSLLGQTGANSLTGGLQSQIGRVLDKKEFDQTTCTAFPGSSGGGVYLADGAYVGMLVRGAGEGFNLCIPVRRIRKWATAVGVEWAIDDTQKMPSEEELRKLPIEDTGVSFERDEKAMKEFPYLIREIGK